MNQACSALHSLVLWSALALCMGPVAAWAQLTGSPEAGAETVVVRIARENST